MSQKEAINLYFQTFITVIDAKAIIHIYIYTPEPIHIITKSRVPPVLIGFV